MTNRENYLRQETTVTLRQGDPVALITTDSYHTINRLERLGYEPISGSRYEGFYYEVPSGLIFGRDSRLLNQPRRSREKRIESLVRLYRSQQAPSAEDNMEDLRRRAAAAVDQADRNRAERRRAGSGSGNIKNLGRPA